MFFAGKLCKTVPKDLGKGKGKGKAIALQFWTGPKGFGKLRLPDFKKIDT
jgi:hypothetical protein